MQIKIKDADMPVGLFARNIIFQGLQRKGGLILTFRIFVGPPPTVNASTAYCSISTIWRIVASPQPSASLAGPGKWAI